MQQTGTLVFRLRGVEPDPLRLRSERTPPSPKACLGLRHKVSQPDGREAAPFHKDVTAVNAAIQRLAIKTYRTRGGSGKGVDGRESQRYLIRLITWCSKPNNPTGFGLAYWMREYA